MWLAPSSLQRAFAAESAGSTKACAPDSNGSASIIALRCCVSGKPTLRPSSWRGWKTRAWSRALFGAVISPTSTGDRFADWWTSQLRACRASPTAPLASNADSTTSAAMATEAVQSRTSCESWPSVSPPWCSSKTSLPGFEADGFDLSERNYAEWVTSSLSRSLSLRSRLARATSGSGFSSWPTPYGLSGQNGPDGNEFSTEVRRWQSPTANPATYTAGNAPGYLTLVGEAQNWATPVGQPANGTPEAFLERKRKEVENGSTMGICLSDLNLQTQQWATPAAHARCADPREVDHGIQLANQVDQWPSPRAEDSQSCGNHPNATDSLTGAMNSWASPAARDWKSGSAAQVDKPRKEQLNDQAAAQLWQTPNLPNGGGKTRGGERSDEMLLEGQAPEFLRQVLSANTGEPLSPTGRNLRPRLNPAFVCWLMGSPTWWTRAEPINFAAQATAAWRSKLRSHLSNLCGGSDDSAALVADEGR